MAKQTRTTLKSFFQTGDVPTENNYADLIDSNLNLSENNTGDIQLTGNITASSNISSSGIVFASILQVDQSVLIEGQRIVYHSAGDNLKIEDSGLWVEGGHITASGNISSSGNLSVTGDLTITGKSSFTGNITASGNISSSGNLILDGEITASGNISASGAMSAGSFAANDIGGFRFKSDTIRLIDDSASGGGDNLQISLGGLNAQGNITASSNISASGKLIASTLNTGQGDNELYEMNQNVKTTSAVTFATVNTGQGDNELYEMDQDVKTTSSPTFSFLGIQNGIALESVRNNAFSADISDSGVNVGSVYGGKLSINNVPSTDPGRQIANFVISAARCTINTIVVASGDSRCVLVGPNSIQGGEFRLNLSTGAEIFPGGTIKINFMLLGT